MYLLHCRRSSFNSKRTRSFLSAAPTHAQQAAAALRRPFQHGLPATCEPQHSMLQQMAAALPELAAVRQTPPRFAVRGRQPQSWPCQVDAQRSQRQILQLLAARPAAEDQSLAARLERWAQRSDAVEWRMDSVRRKRKHKMNKVLIVVASISRVAMCSRLMFPTVRLSCQIMWRCSCAAQAPQAAEGAAAQDLVPHNERAAAAAASHSSRPHVSLAGVTIRTAWLAAAVRCVQLGGHSQLGCGHVLVSLPPDDIGTQVRQHAYYQVSSSTGCKCS